jgi:antitoxin MazE
MTSQLRKIGNSQGVIIPKFMLQQLGIEKEISIQIFGNQIIIEPKAKTPRAGWEEQIKKAIETEGPHEGDMFPGIVNDFDKEDWTWE